MVSQAPGKVVTVVLFKGYEAGIEQIALRDNDHVEAWRDLVSTEDLSNESFSPVSLNSAPQLARGGDAEPSNRQRVREGENRAVAAMNPAATLVHQLKFGAAANSFVRFEGRQSAYGSLLTVRRFRPFARRRFSTSRPFFVLIRTRNPCVLLR